MISVLMLLFVEIWMTAESAAVVNEEESIAAELDPSVQSFADSTTTTAMPTTTTTTAPPPPPTTTTTTTPAPPPAKVPPPTTAPIARTGSCQGWGDLLAAYFPANQVDKACSVMLCESGGNPNAENASSSASGLFQFLDSTWTSTTGQPPPASAYIPEAQIAAAGQLWQSSGWSPWVCA
jgi:hypothetical protein